ncbi:MAG: PIN domain-containing protein, partial [Sediminibacterium sp.]
RKQQPVVIDITVLCFCLFSGSFELLDRLSPDRYISQTTVDEFEREYAEMSQYLNKGRTSVDYNNGQLYTNVIDEGEIKSYLDKLNTLIMWCKSNATITGPSVTVSFWKDRDAMVNVLGHSVSDSIYLTEEKGAIYYCDDAVLSSNLISWYKTKSITTFDVSTYCIENNLISPELFNLLYEKMIDASYISIPGSFHQLWREFDRSNFEIRKPFITACQSFNVFLPNHTSNQVVLFLKKLYSSINVTEKRQMVTQYIFKEISRRKDQQTVFRSIKAKIPVEFKLLYHQALEILEILNDYYQ